MTKELLIALDHAPDALARALDALAGAGAAVEALCGSLHHDRPLLRVILAEPARAEAALHAAGLRWSSHDVLALDVDDDPAALLAVCDKLAAAGVRVLAVHGLDAGDGGPPRVAFRVSDAPAARAAVAEG